MWACPYHVHAVHHPCCSMLLSLAQGKPHLCPWVPGCLGHIVGSQCRVPAGCGRRQQPSSDEAGHGSGRSTVQACWRIHECPPGSGCRFVLGPTELQYLDAAQPGSCTCRACVHCRRGSQRASSRFASVPRPPTREPARRDRLCTASRPFGPCPRRRHSGAAGHSLCRATQQPALAWWPSSEALPFI